MRIRQVVPPAFALVLALALSACGGGGPEPDPTTPAPEPTASETPTPGPDPASAAARIHLGVNHVEIFALDDSPLGDFTMYESAADVVAELTEVFGTAPVVSDDPGGLETAPSRSYDWSGFTVIDPEGLTIMLTDIVITVSTPAVGDVQVYSYFDLQVGDPFSDAIAVADGDGGFPGYGLATVGSLTIDPVSVGEAPGLPLAIYVAVYGDPGGTGPITTITAPTPNWGV